MEIKQALITAAGSAQRHLPLQTLVDRDGVPKTALQILIEEVLEAGIESIVVVVAPGDAPAFTKSAGAFASRLTFIEQTQPLGYGHAVWSAQEPLGGEPFLLLVGDHLYLSSTLQRCAKQLVTVAEAHKCAVSAVQSTHESKLPLYGAVGGRLQPGQRGIYEVSEVIEKPSPTEAEQRLVVPGLRTGHYLCFFGMHVLPPAIMTLLGEEISAADPSRKVHLTHSLARLASRERYLAAELNGRRYDIGLKYGILTAQLALALSGKEREEVLAGLVDMLARRDP